MTEEYHAGTHCRLCRYNGKNVDTHVIPDDCLQHVIGLNAALQRHADKLKNQLRESYQAIVDMAAMIYSVTGCKTCKYNAPADDFECMYHGACYHSGGVEQSYSACPEFEYKNDTVRQLHIAQKWLSENK